MTTHHDTLAPPAGISSVGALALARFTTAFDQRRHSGAS
jgi:hypothetical protein